MFGRNVNDAGNHVCGLYFTTQGFKRTYLPQVEILSNTTINPVCFTTNLEQTFRNPNDEILSQVRYTFPLYDGVAVNSYSITYGGKTLKGVVKQKDIAKQDYQTAVDRGETAGLLTSLPAGVFGVTLGNIPANADIVVDITYCGELKHDAGIDGLRYMLPTSIAPRYGDYPGEVAQSNAVAKKGITIRVEMDMASSAIRRVQSPSHPIAVSMGGLLDDNGEPSTSGEFKPSQAAATLALGTTELGSDFVLQLLIDDMSKPQAIMEAHPTISNQRAIMATLVPNFVLEPSHPEIVFIADQSGSMSGQKNAALVSALKVFLKSLPLGVRFNICAFGNHFKFLWPTSQAYNESNVNAAVSFVNGFKASYGGTEILQPITAAFEQRLKDLPLEVMLLTDGEVWGESSLFAYINEQIRDKGVDARVFALGIGNDVSHTLVEGVARAGNGFAQFVTQNEDTDQKVIRMLKGALYAHTKNYELDVHYAEDVRHNITDEEDFEIVEKVNDCLNITDSPPKDPPMPAAPKSFFDTSAQPDKPPKVSADRYAHLPIVETPKLLQAPYDIPPLFPFNRTTVFLLLGPDSVQKPIKSVTLRAMSAQGPLELNIPVNQETTNDNQGSIHHLAARKALQDLEEGRGWIQAAKLVDGTPVKTKHESRFDELVEREGVRLGEKFQVASKWTSFVALEGRPASNMEDSEDDEDTDPEVAARMEVQEQKLRSEMDSKRVRKRKGAARGRVMALADEADEEHVVAQRYVDLGAVPFGARDVAAAPIWESSGQRDRLSTGSGSSTSVVTGLFGQSQAQATHSSTGGLFGSSTHAAGGLFGQPTGGLFGQPRAQQSSSEGLFGASSSATGGLFGSATGQGTNSNHCGFGSVPHQGSSLTGNPNNGSGQAFGGFGSSNPSRDGFSFSSPTARTQPFSGSGVAESGLTGGGLFGSSQSTSGGLFGGIAQKGFTPKDVAANNTSLFGNIPAANPSGSSGNLFKPGSLFGPGGVLDLSEQEVGGADAVASASKPATQETRNRPSSDGSTHSPHIGVDMTACAGLGATSVVSDGDTAADHRRCDAEKAAASETKSAAMSPSSCSNVLVGDIGSQDSRVTHPIAATGSSFTFGGGRVGAQHDYESQLMVPQQQEKAHQHVTLTDHGATSSDHPQAESKATTSAPSYPPSLQDYEMQLMLLEQQNKKRLLMARMEQDAMSGPRPQPRPDAAPLEQAGSSSGAAAALPECDPLDAFDFDMFLRDDSTSPFLTSPSSTPQGNLELDRGIRSGRMSGNSFSRLQSTMGSWLSKTAPALSAREVTPPPPPAASALAAPRMQSSTFNASPPPPAASAPPPAPLGGAEALCARRTGARDRSSWSADEAEIDGSTAEPVEKKAEEPEKTLHALISLQSFSGCWRWNEQLFTVLRVDVNKIDKAEINASTIPQDAQNDADACATALVLAWLELKLPARKEVWEMVAQKAKGWLAHWVAAVPGQSGGASATVVLEMVDGARTVLRGLGV